MKAPPCFSLGYSKIYCFGQIPRNIGEIERYVLWTTYTRLVPCSGWHFSCSTFRIVGKTTSCANNRLSPMPIAFQVFVPPLRSKEFLEHAGWDLNEYHLPPWLRDEPDIKTWPTWRATGRDGGRGGFPGRQPVVGVKTKKTWIQRYLPFNDWEKILREINLAITYFLG